uniref:60S acidic ribosomal protein P1 n=1 Tax=Globisporangium ultimum (strain ATCC 200006 / CBS 805.95 / DAOM BR144) TaxID=431595 RepID=K3WB98_GLOUD
MSFADLSATQKEELATSLAVLAIYDAQAEVTAENIASALSASGNDVAAYVPQLFADLIGRGLVIDKFLAGPSAGGAAPAAGAAGAGAAAAPVAEEKEEEEEADLGAGMDMFGGGADY